MEVSRLIFTKETKDKMSKPLNHFKKGELRWAKLKELEDSGQLSKAKNRLDISAMIGMGSSYGAGYAWVSTLVQKGHIKETMLGFNKDNKMEYEYHLGKAPDYSPQRKAGKTRKVKLAKDKPAIVKNTTSTYTPTYSKATVIIRYKDLTIELNDIDTSVIENIIEKLADR